MPPGTPFYIFQRHAPTLSPQTPHPKNFQISLTTACAYTTCHMAKMYEHANRKCIAADTMVQTSTPAPTNPKISTSGIAMAQIADFVYSRQRSVAIYAIHCTANMFEEAKSTISYLSKSWTSC